MACVQVENRTSLLGEPRILRKKPMLILPRLDGRLVQHPPNGTAADLFAQRLLRPPHQIAKRLPAQGFFGFGDDFTRHGMDQRLIQRGKKRACAHAQPDLQWKNPRWPNVFANAAPAAAKGQRHRQRPHFVGWAAHEGATRGDNAAQPAPQRYVVEPCRVHLARNCRGRYNDRALDLA